MRLLLSILIVCWLVPGFAQNSGDNQQATTAKASKAKPKKKKGTGNAALSNIVGGQSGWRLQGMASHMPALRRDQEDLSDFLLRADYTFNKKHRIRVQQFMLKSYSKYASENAFKAFDTSLIHFYTPNWKPLGWRVMWGNSLTLPISHESVRDDLYTRYTSNLIASKSILNGKAMIFGIPYARYHFYEYKTSVSGTPLPWYTVGMSLTMLYFISPKLTAMVSGNYNFEGLRSSQFDPNQRSIFSTDQINNGLYRWDLDMTYQATKHIALSVYYTQGWANYIQQGRYEWVFFDDQASRVGAGFTYVY